MSRKRINFDNLSCNNGGQLTNVQQHSQHQQNNQPTEFDDVDDFDFEDDTPQVQPSTTDPNELYERKIKLCELMSKIGFTRKQFKFIWQFSERAIGSKPEFSFQSLNDFRNKNYDKSTGKWKPFEKEVDREVKEDDLGESSSTSPSPANPPTGNKRSNRLTRRHKP